MSPGLAGATDAVAPLASRLSPLASRNYILSNTAAMPWPPPIHIVTSA